MFYWDIVAAAEDYTDLFQVSSLTFFWTLFALKMVFLKSAEVVGSCLQELLIKPYEVYMSLEKNKLKVLAILSENLKKIQPQLVPSTAIAEKMNMSLPELQQVLKSMEGVGVIETDPDQQYNLITQKGLHRLGKQRPVS